MQFFRLIVGVALVPLDLCLFEVACTIKMASLHAPVIPSNLFILLSKLWRKVKSDQDKISFPHVKYLPYTTHLGRQIFLPLSLSLPPGLCLSKIFFMSSSVVGCGNLDVNHPSTTTTGML